MWRLVGIKTLQIKPATKGTTTRTPERRQPAALNPLFFLFDFFFTLHQRTLKCYKEMCLTLRGKEKKNKENNRSSSSSSTDADVAIDWCSTGNQQPQKKHIIARKDNGTFAKLKCKFNTTTEKQKSKKIKEN